MHIKTLIIAIAFIFLTAFTTIKYDAEVVAVTDGDTIIVKIAEFPVPFNPIAVRIYGIDTPESRTGPTGAKCEKERKLGIEAKTWLKAKLPPGTKITVVWTGIHEKYGRLLSNVFVNNIDIGQELIKKNYAKPYFGQTKSKWCN